MAIIEGFDRLGVGLDMSSFSGGLTFFSTEGVPEPLLLDFNFFLDGTFDATYQSPGALAEFFVIFGEVFSDGLLVTDVFYFDEFINSVLNLGFIDVFISNEDLLSGGTDWFLFALLGDDLLIGNNFGDVLKGGERDDTLFGEGGDDNLFGESGDDDLHGGFGDDTLSGGQGDDRLEGGTGVNRLEGGTGTDSAVFAGSFAAYSITLAPGGVTLSRNGETTTAVSVETFLFEDRTLSLADVLAAIPATPPVTPPPVEPPVTPPPVAPPTTPSAPSPTGPTQGDDAMSGTGGPDRMSALSGDDTMRGLGGDDTLLGQGGNDVLRGGGGDDSLAGGGGADRLFGQAADDTLKGGGAADFLKGGGGADRLIGGGGADTIEGGKGADTMIGGGGADTFRFAPGDGADVILRFQQGADQIEFKRGVSGFDALTIEQQGDDVLVTYTRGSILVENQNAGAFGEGDFIF